MYNLEFLNRNSLINYPIREDASRAATSGDFVLPNSTIVDFVMVVPENLASRTIYLRQLTYLGDLLNFEFADDLGNLVAMGVVVISTHVPFTAYDLNGVGQYLSAKGKLVLGKLDDLIALPNGAYQFVIAATAMEPTTFRPDIRGINGLVLVTGGTESAPIYGDLQLLAGTNFQLTETAPGVVELDALDGSGLSVTDPCAVAFTPPPPIRTINGLGPDTNGNFGLQGSACLNVATSAALIQLTDTCSSACCGCAELEWITERMEILLEQNIAMTAFSNSMQAALTAFQNNVLATTT